MLLSRWVQKKWSGVYLYNKTKIKRFRGYAKEKMMLQAIFAYITAKMAK